MSEEITRKSHTYKSSAERIGRRLLRRAIAIAAASLIFTFFCLFSHASSEELTEKYVNVLSVFILFIVFMTGSMMYIAFSRIVYKRHKNRIMARGTQTGGKILRSQMIHKMGGTFYSFTVRLESKELFESEYYDEDCFKNDNCTECTVYSLNGEYIIGEFIEIIKPAEVSSERKSY